MTLRLKHVDSLPRFPSKSFELVGRPADIRRLHGHRSQPAVFPVHVCTSVEPELEGREIEILIRPDDYWPLYNYINVQLEGPSLICNVVKSVV